MGVCKLRKRAIRRFFAQKRISHSFQQVLCIQRGGKRFLLISITAQQQTYDTYLSSVKIEIA